jgi:flagellar biosynthetic protein FliR
LASSLEVAPLTDEQGVFGSNVIFATFVLFCRIGTCLMLAPGLSNGQIPMQVRLYVAVAVTLALAPMLLGQSQLHDLGDDPIAMLRLIAMESLIGGMIGLLGRLFFSALETMAVAAANLLGLVNPFGVEIDPNQAMPPLASLVALAATALIFVSDLHWEIIRGLTASYKAIPIHADFDAPYSLRQIGLVLGESFGIAIRVTSPFFLYSVIANFALTLINRVTPQIAIFYVAPPFVVAGGLLLLYFVVRAQVGEFISSFGAWLSWG